MLLELTRNGLETLNTPVDVLQDLHVGLLLFVRDLDVHPAEDAVEVRGGRASANAGAGAGDKGVTESVLSRVGVHLESGVRFGMK